MGKKSHPLDGATANASAIDFAGKAAPINPVADKRGHFSAPPAVRFGSTNDGGNRGPAGPPKAKK